MVTGVDEDGSVGWSEVVGAAEPHAGIKSTSAAMADKRNECLNNFVNMGEIVVGRSGGIEYRVARNIGWWLGRESGVVLADLLRI